MKRYKKRLSKKMLIVTLVLPIMMCVVIIVALAISFMKKRVIAFLCAALLLLSSAGTISAIEPRASTVIAGYGIGLEANGDSVMTVNFRVYAPQVVKKIGAVQIEIKYFDGEDWAH